MQDTELDTRGTFCPVPIIEAAKAIKPLSPGSVLRVVATDPGIISDLPAWCEACGHTLLSLERRGPVLVGRIRKKEAACRKELA